jgi:hypothetical protein
MGRGFVATGMKGTVEDVDAAVAAAAAFATACD